MSGFLRVAMIASAVMSGVFGCSSNSSEDNGSVAGKTIDSKSLVVGGAQQEVTLGTPARGATVVFPAGVARAMTPVTVNLQESVKKKRATVPAPVVEVTTMAVMFEMPARMRQPLPPPAPGRRYVAVNSTRQGDTWTVNRGGVRVVSADAPDAGVPPEGGSDASLGGEVDAGLAPASRSSIARAEVVLEVYEIDVTGPGYWGIGVEDMAEPVDSGMPNTPIPMTGGTSCADALAKLRACNFSFMPAGVDPCLRVDEEDACGIACIAKASCAQLNTFYCSPATADQNDPFFQCFLECEGPAEPAPIACGVDTYTEEDRCDGFAVCMDGADEAGCPTFTCGDGSTVPEEFKCDGSEDCADGTDEAGCPAESELFCPNGMPAGDSDDEPAQP